MRRPESGNSSPRNPGNERSGLFGDLFRRAEVRRGRAGEKNALARGRMNELELMRVKVVPGVARERSAVPIGRNDRQATGAIERVVNQRMTGGSEVDPDLMGAAGDEIDADQAPVGIGITIENAAFRPGRFSRAGCSEEGSGWGIGNPPNGHIHRKPVGHFRAGSECAVDLAYPTVSKILR